MMIPHFENSLRAEHLGDHWWRTLEPLVYHSVLIEAQITVPPGFVTDLASALIVGRRAQAAATVHDMLYRWDLVSRKTADQIFLEAMLAVHEPTIICWTAYFGVRCFGWLARKKRDGCLEGRCCEETTCGQACRFYYPGWAHSINYN